MFESQVKHPSYILDLTFITFKKRYTKYSRFKFVLFSDPFSAHVHSVKCFQAPSCCKVYFIYFIYLFYFILFATLITKNIGKEEEEKKKKKWRGDLTETIGAYERLGLLEL